MMTYPGDLQAFPKTGNYTENGLANYDSEDSDGMDLRTYIAIQALNGYLAGRNLDGRDSNKLAVAKECVAYAEALISELYEL